MSHITHLNRNEIFVFGSNSGGFHGAGSAGMAMRGDSRNTWRNDPSFLLAMNSAKHSPDRIGKWAVFGVARGFQTGKEGSAYGIETIRRPGQLRSISLSEIQAQFQNLFSVAEQTILHSTV